MNIGWGIMKTDPVKVFLFIGLLILSSHDFFWISAASAVNTTKSSASLELNDSGVSFSPKLQ